MSNSESRKTVDRRIAISDHTPVIFFDGVHCVEQRVFPGFDPLEIWDARKAGKTPEEVRAIEKYDYDLETSSPDAAVEYVEYPEFFGWRLEHLTGDQKRQLMEPGSDMMIITPDCLDQFYREPEPWGEVQRCNRCLSTDLDWQPEWIVCKSCNWSEPLYDFPVARRY